MKKNICAVKKVFAPALWLLLMSAQYIQAQVCTSPSTTIYGLSNAGFLYPVNVGDGVAGAQMNPSYSGYAPQSSNGVGYNQLNGKFYYFKRPPGSTPQEFVVYDPAMNSVTVLDTCPTLNPVYVGCVSNNGTAYYCWDSQARLFYYNIASNTWRLITTTIVDQGGVDVDAVLRSHGSGDAAFDGNGNLLMMPSSNSRYALYRMNAPLPTTPVASITVTGLVPLTSPPPGGKFGGIAFNSTGQILISSATPDNKLYRLENNLTLTLIANLSRDLGDLTSCNFPLIVLPSLIKHFSVKRNSGAIELQWQLASSGGMQYVIEHSIDLKKWQQLSLSPKMSSGITGNSFIHLNAVVGTNHYRMKLFSGSSSVYSEVKSIELQGRLAFTVWPNPVQETLFISGTTRHQVGSVVILSDHMGNIVSREVLKEGTNVINMKRLASGCYILKIESGSGAHFLTRLIRKT